jgi:branched-chain amino acid transport system permease protein
VTALRRAAVPLLGRAVAAVLYLGVVVAVFDPPVELISTGIANGALYGLMAVGVILVHRTNRIINFAAAGLGAVPGVLAALLVAAHGWPFVPALLLALLGAAALGALADLTIVRRFADAPRLVLTVATLGLVQLLAFAGIELLKVVGTGGDTASAIRTPFSRFTYEVAGRTLLRGQQVFAVVVVVALTVGLAQFSTRTRLGIAVRASAENPDRALLLGVPVRLVGTVAWAVAGLFAGTTIFLRSTLVGVPFDGSLGYGVLLFALAAAVVGRMEDTGTALLAGIAIGVLEQASVASTGSPDLTTAIMLVVILGALLLQRGSTSRALDAAAALQTGRPQRRTPTELRGLLEVRAARIAVLVVAGAIAIAAPLLVGAGDLPSLTLLPIYAMVSVSLVVLTGWAGQVSLGQMAIVGVAAAVAAGLAADHDLDFFLVLAIAVAVGVAASVVVAIPAVRLQGLYLAVTTLALAGACEFWLLKKPYPVARFLLPKGEAARVRRPQLWQRLDLANDRVFYYVCLAALAGVLYLASRFRRSRSGRVFLSVRDNSRAAPAYGIDVIRTRLSAFALSGAIASLAGVLFVYQQQTFDATTYGIGPSVQVFVAAAIGGLGSLSGGVLGAVVVYAVKLFGERVQHNASLIVTGPGLLLVLVVLPGGLSQLLDGARERFLRGVAARHRIDVPSLTADRRAHVEDEPDLVDAEEHAEHVALAVGP